jgi:hypothetical protein
LFFNGKVKVEISLPWKNKENIRNNHSTELKSLLKVRAGDAVKGPGTKKSLEFDLIR